MKLKFNALAITLLVMPALIVNARHSFPGIKHLHLNNVSTGIYPLPGYQDSAFNRKELKMLCDDSTVVDKQNNWIILYGHAVVTYKAVSIKGDRLIIDELSHQVQASSNAGAPGERSAKSAVYSNAGRVIKEAHALIVNLKTQECRVISK